MFWSVVNFNSRRTPVDSAVDTRISGSSKTVYYQWHPHETDEYIDECSAFWAEGLDSRCEGLGSWCEGLGSWCEEVDFCCEEPESSYEEWSESDAPKRRIGRTAWDTTVISLWKSRSSETLTWCVRGTGRRHSVEDISVYLQSKTLRLYQCYRTGYMTYSYSKLWNSF